MAFWYSRPFSLRRPFSCLPRCRLLGMAPHAGELQSDMVSTVHPLGHRGDPAGRPHPTTAIKIRTMTMRSHPSQQESPSPLPPLTPVRLATTSLAAGSQGATGTHGCGHHRQSIITRPRRLCRRIPAYELLPRSRGHVRTRMLDTAAKYSNERTAQHDRRCPEASGPASVRLEAVRARSSGREVAGSPRHL